MTISVEQAQLSLKELIRKTSQGEEVVITQDQLPVAELRSLISPHGSTANAKRTWLEFQALGSELATTSVPGLPSLTDAVSRMRNEIEVGWQQSERGDVVDGPEVFAEIRKLSRAKR